MLLRLVLAGLLSAGLSSAQKIYRDWDDQADFSGYKSYRIKPGRVMGDNPHRTVEREDPSLDFRILNALRNALASRGFYEAGEDPDVFVTYLIGLVGGERVSGVSTTYMSGYGYGYRHPAYWGTGWTNVMVRNYVEGTIIVDLIDAEQDILVWRTYISGELKNLGKPEKMDQRLDKTLKKAFSKYPPKIKKK